MKQKAATSMQYLYSIAAVTGAILYGYLLYRNMWISDDGYIYLSYVKNYMNNISSRLEIMKKRPLAICQGTLFIENQRIWTLMRAAQPFSQPYNDFSFCTICSSVCGLRISQSSPLVRNRISGGWV